MNGEGRIPGEPVTGTVEKNDGIDFVLPWVDGADKEWQGAFTRYAATHDGDMRQCRYRDWGNLRYIFRGFDAFAPWVRKIHFVT